MTTKQLFKNNVNATLATPITTNIATEIYLAAGLGNNFPSITSSDWFDVTVYERVGTVESNHEVMKVTARVSDTLTVVRGQEGTTARTFLDTSKTYVAMRATSGTFENLLQVTDNLEGIASAATARTNLGLGSIATQAASAVAITGGDITGITDITVADGGTGRSTGITAYALVATGTTSTGAQQTLASGATTEILVGGGAAALPVWTTVTGTGAPVRATSPTFVTPILGVAAATSVATSAASPLLLTNAQLVTVALTAQTVGGTTLTIPDFASVADEFTFQTKSQTLSNKTFVAPVLGVATATSLNGHTFTAGSSTFTGTAAQTYTFPAATTTVAGLATTETFTAPQRGTQTTDNDLSFDMNVTNNFKCTTAGAGTLTFTNITAGQSGNILLINASNHAIAAAATTKVATGMLTAISATGSYLLGYYSDGTNVYVAATGALA